MKDLANGISGASRRAPILDVLFVLPHLGPGGAQRVASLLANYWHRQGRKVGVLTLFDNIPDVQQLDPGIYRKRVVSEPVCRETTSSSEHAVVSLTSGAALDVRSQGARGGAKPAGPHAENGRGDAPRTPEEPRGRYGWPSRMLRAIARRVTVFARRVRRYLLSLNRNLHKRSAQSSMAIVAVTRWLGIALRFRVAELGLPVKGADAWRSAKLRAPPRIASPPRWWTSARARSWFPGAHNRIEKIRATIVRGQPKVVISFLGATNIQAVVAAQGLQTPVIVSERNDPSLQQLQYPWEQLRPAYYARADLVTANSAGAVRALGRFVPAAKLRQVANPLDIPARVRPAHVRERRIVTVARLVHQKGIDTLIEAFSAVAPTIPGWRLDVVGEGPLRPQLERLAQTRGVAHLVSFYGHQPTPFTYLSRARIFVLPSRFEGMPNAMLEAMGYGLAVVTTSASPGPLEFIKDGVSGLVVPPNRPRALARALERLTSDEALLDAVAGAARARAETLSLARVAASWDDCMRSVAGNLPCFAGEAKLGGKPDAEG